MASRQLGKGDVHVSFYSSFCHSSCVWINLKCGGVDCPLWTELGNARFLLSWEGGQVQLTCNLRLATIWHGHHMGSGSGCWQWGHDLHSHQGEAENLGDRPACGTAGHCRPMGLGQNLGLPLWSAHGLCFSFRKVQIWMVTHHLVVGLTLTVLLSL